MCRYCAIALLFLLLAFPALPSAQPATPALPQEIRSKLEWLSEMAVSPSKPLQIMLRYCQSSEMSGTQDLALMSQLLDTFVREEVIPLHEKELLKLDKRPSVTSKLALFSLGIVRHGNSERILPVPGAKKLVVPPDPFQGTLVRFQDQKSGIAFVYRPSGWVLFREGTAFALFPKGELVRNRYFGLAILPVPSDLKNAYGLDQQQAARKILEEIAGFAQGVPVGVTSGQGALSGFEVKAPEERQGELAWGEVLFGKNGERAVVLVGRAQKDRFMAFKKIFDETGRSLNFGGEGK